MAVRSDELTAGNAAGNRGGARNTGTEDFLLLPASGPQAFLPPWFLTSWGLLPCSGSSDRCSCQLRTFWPRASRSSSHRYERWEGCRV